MVEEPGLEDLLEDEMMELVARSANLTRDELRRHLSEIALRVHMKSQYKK
jgi:hypothetical protein